jgi:tetratricopeptide (TPR) repeat protein
MSAIDPNTLERAYAEAAHAYQSGNLPAALARLGPVLAADPPDSRIHALAGFIGLRSGDPASAVKALLRAHLLDPRQAVFALALGDALLANSQPEDAEAAYRKAVALDRSSVAAVIGLAAAISQSGRPVEGREVLEKRLAAGDRDHRLLVALSEAQTQTRQARAAVETSLLAVKYYPDSAVAYHNLAAALGDMRQYAEAEQAVRKAISLGVNGPATRVVLARALEGLGRIEEAIAAYRVVLSQAPLSVDPNRELAQLIWMRTGDLAQASEHLLKQLAMHPDDTNLIRILAKLKRIAGDPDGARALLEAAIDRVTPPNEHLFMDAAEIATAQGDAPGALRLARRGYALVPNLDRMLVILADACLGMGEAEEALRISQRLLDGDPNDQNALARKATALRLTGDTAYRRLYDYDRYVRAYDIETPDGWPDLAAYLADLSKTLVEMHGFSTAPFDQSLRGGSQTSQNLSLSLDPVIQAFFKAIDGPIRAHMEHLGTEPDGIGRRCQGDYELAGSWSVFLRPNGYHVDHIHNEGWLSSAFYVELPTAPDDAPREGWIKFGEPGVPTEPRLWAEHYVQPQPGRLVLFPSYMWHGTVPFTRDERRITIAFDVQPRAGRPPRDLKRGA